MRTHSSIAKVVLFPCLITASLVPVALRKQLLAEFFNKHNPAASDEARIHGLVDTLPWSALKAKLYDKYGSTISDEHHMAHVHIYGTLTTIPPRFLDPDFAHTVESLVSAQTLPLDALYIVIPHHFQRFGDAPPLPGWLADFESPHDGPKIKLLRPDKDMGPGELKNEALQRFLTRFAT